MINNMEKKPIDFQLVGDDLEYILMKKKDLYDILERLEKFGDKITTVYDEKGEGKI